MDKYQTHACSVKTNAVFLKRTSVEPREDVETRQVDCLLEDPHGVVQQGDGFA
jgi:hypothetical protein